MLCLRLSALGLALCSAALADLNSPDYSSAGIVNAADNKPGPLAPNTLASIYGVRLSYVTAAITSDDIHGGVLPTVLPGTGVSVLVGNIAANIYYVSPNQINFLVPAILVPGPSKLQVVLNAHSGPAVDITLAAYSPALFQIDAQNAVALQPDGTVITAKNPAKPGDVVILYATGLGQTFPPVEYGAIFEQAAPLQQISEFKVTFDGVAASHAVEYAGIAPGFAGLYQLNIVLPKSTHANPEIRIGLGSDLSTPGIHLPVE